jgi:hypothetical protein
MIKNTIGSLLVIVLVYLIWVSDVPIVSNNKTITHHKNDSIIFDSIIVKTAKGKDSLVISSYSIIPYNKRIAILDSVAHSYLYVKEIKPNWSPEIDLFMAAAGLPDNKKKFQKTGEGYYWCGGYICKCLEVAGFYNPKTGWAASIVKHNSIYKKSSGKKLPTQSMMMGGIYYPNLKRMGHVLFIIKSENDYIITIEGNTGIQTGTSESDDRNGQGVCKKKRKPSSIHEASAPKEIKI